MNGANAREREPSRSSMKQVCLQFLYAMIYPPDGWPPHACEASVASRSPTQEPPSHGPMHGPHRTHRSCAHVRLRSVCVSCSTRCSLPRTARGKDQTTQHDTLNTSRLTIEEPCAARTGRQNAVQPGRSPLSRFSAAERRSREYGIDHIPYTAAAAHEAAAGKRLSWQEARCCLGEVARVLTC